jgi:hypothetical protein
MVPVYAIDSFLSLLFKEQALVFNLLRDCYEAYVICISFVIEIKQRSHYCTTYKRLLRRRLTRQICSLLIWFVS